MGISEEAAKLRANVPEQFQPRGALASLGGLFASSPSADEVRASTSALNTAQDTDIERIVIEGQEAIAAGPLTEGERRNLEARLAADIQDDAREAERSGTRVGRIEVTGLGSKDQERAKAQARQRIKDDARMQQILALQAALDGLNEKIAELDGVIGDIEDRYLSPADKARIQALPKDQQFAAKDARFRQMVEDKEMPQHDYDNWKAAYRDRQKFMQDRDGVIRDLKAASPGAVPEVAHKLLQAKGSEAVEAAADKLQGFKREATDAATERHVDQGNAEQQQDLQKGIAGLATSGLEELFSGAPPVKDHFETSSKSLATDDNKHDQHVEKTASLNFPIPGNG